jgi:IS4 transposase
MFRPSSQFNRTVRAPQLLDAFVALVQPHLGLTLTNTYIRETDMLYVLGYAALESCSLEHACLELKRAPSGNRLREVLHDALPDTPTLQRRLNTLLRRQLPACLRKGQRDYAVAIDVVLIPYHGQAQQQPDEVYKAGAKSGTKHFHAYATVAIVHHRRRYTLALRFVRAGETMVQIVRALLDRVKRLKIRVRRVYLDKEFYAVAVFRTLARRGLSYIVPMQARGKQGGVTALLHGPRSYLTLYHIHSDRYGDQSVQAVVVRRYSKGKYGRHGVRWFAFAVAGLSGRCTPAQVFQLYRQRFGIESTYRQVNQVRARTCSRSPALRLLLMGLALLLVNLYVTWRFSTQSPRAATQSPRRRDLTVRHLAQRLARAIERLLGLAFFDYALPSHAFS